jgi:hypothetical protein
MAPEQGRNAAAVDQRADIYSLGCTLYVLLTGRPPFTGRTAMEIITKHLKDPVVRPDAIVKRVPKTISDILVKMLAKKPEDRHQDMGELIADLEKFLGVQQAGPFTPKEEHATLLEESVKEFNNVPAARLRSLSLLGFYGACALLTIICLVAKMPFVAAGFLGLGVMTTVAAFVINGIVYKPHLFLKTRELIWSSTWSDWLIWAGCGLVLLMVLWLLHLLLPWLTFLILAVGWAAAFHFVVERKLHAQRQAPLEKAEGLLRTMRLGGLEEDAIRQFVCKYAGNEWEPLYEALFGYEMLLHARQYYTRGESKPRPHHATWRDPLINWIEARQKALKEAREKKHLLQVEQKQLEAQGLAAAEARAKAERVAQSLVMQAEEIRQQAEEGSALSLLPDDGDEAPPPPRRPRRKVSEMLASADQLAVEEAPRRRKGPGLLTTVMRLVFGVKARLAVGLVLVGLGAWWVQRNKELMTTLEGLVGDFEWPKKLPDTDPLRIMGFPPENVAQLLFNNFNAIVAGVLLIFSTFFQVRRTSIAFVLGALIVFLGPLGLKMAEVEPPALPVVGTLAPGTLSLGAGVLLAVIGFLIGSFIARKD